MSNWTPTKGDEARVKSLIRKLVTSGKPELDKSVLKELKQICKNGGDITIKESYKNCMHHLLKPHSQVRVSVVQLIDYFFQKTHKFRALLLDDFDIFLESTIQLSQNKDNQVKLPPPKKYARILKENTAKCIYRWHADYSTGYEKLRYAYRYLREHGIVDFGQFRVLNHQDLLRQTQVQAQRDRQLTRTIERKLKELEEIYPSMEELVVQIESLLEIVIPSVDGNRIFDMSGDDSDKMKDTIITHSGDFDPIGDHFQQHGMLASSKQMVQVEFSRYVAIKKDIDNEEMIKTLKEFRRQLVETKLQQLNTIIKILSRRTEVCTNELKRAIDLKHRAMNSIIKLSDLKIVSVKDSDTISGQNSIQLSGVTLHHDSSDEDSDDFEEVQPKEDLESYIPKHLLTEYGIEPALDLPDQPVRLVNDDAHIFEPSTSSGQQGKILQCNALLPTGKLCPRRDKIKCPFHGPIVERDFQGFPVKEDDRRREEKLKDLNRGDVPEWQDPTLLSEIKAAIGIDLTMPSNKKSSSKGLHRNNRLEDTKTCDLTPQQRLQKRMKKISTS